MNRHRPERLISLFLLALLPAAGFADVNRIVLRVNERIATLYDYEQLKRERIVSIERAEISSERRQALLANLGEATMRELYEELLVLSRADQLDVRIPEKSIQEALERAKASFGIETEEDFERALAQSGMTREDLREQMTRNLKIREVIGREVHTRIELEDEDLRRHYQANLEDFRVPEKLELSELVVLELDGSDPAERAALAAELKERIVAGTLSDEELAAYREEGAVAGWIGLGWVERGDLDPSLEEAAWGLEAGAVSDPVEARGGLHLLRVNERTAAEVRSFDQVRPQIEARLGNERFREELSKYMSELEGRSYIVFQPPPDAAGFRPDTRGPAAEGLAGLEQALPAVAEAAGESAGPDAAEAPEPAAPEGDEPSGNEPPGEAEPPPADLPEPPAERSPTS